MSECNEKIVLKIGEVAKLNRISTDTLRYYSKIGIFKEDYTDENGYRYYYADHLKDLDLVIWLRMNDMPIEDIKEILQNRSLDIVIDYFEKQKEMLEKQIEDLTKRWQNCCYYQSEMSYVRSMQLGKCALIPYSTRYYLTGSQTVPPEDLAGFEMELKGILARCNNKSKYYNTFFGAVFAENKANEDGYERDMQVAIFSILDSQYEDGLVLPGGIYAVMPVPGDFFAARSMVPEFIRQIRDKGYQPVSPCLILKIWETNLETESELTVIQILVKR